MAVPSNIAKKWMEAVVHERSAEQITFQAKGYSGFEESIIKYPRWQ
jgi:hypothetical protein